MTTGRRRTIPTFLWLLLAVGALVTIALAGAAQAAYEENEDRLLQQRSEEAAAVVDAALPGVEAPLAELSRLADAVGDSDQALLYEIMESLVAEGRFVSMSVLSVSDANRVATVGEPAKADGLADLIADASGSQPAAAAGPLRVIGLLDGSDPRLGYLYAPAGVEAVYAEQAMPSDRVSQVPPEDAFANLEHALYLGDREELDQLMLASTTELPLDGRRASVQIELGDTTLFLVMSPTGTLGGGLLAKLPWLVLVVGASTTALGAISVTAQHGRRTDAEALSREIATLYAREHEIAHTLQQSLLPSSLPVVRGLEVAARYVAGAQGTEVGGDWYDLIELGDDQLVVIVGDAAGRGVQAAAVMAAAQYSARAIATRGASPPDVLSEVNRLPGIRGDFVTMFCGALDLHDRSLVLACAGHPSPLVLDGTDAYYMTGPIGPPVGFLVDAEYRSERVTLPAGATMLLFTDGLYERRGEDIDVGLDRLRHVATGFDGSLEAFLEHVYDEMVGSAESRDDVAMLAVRLVI